MPDHLDRSDLENALEFSNKWLGLDFSPAIHRTEFASTPISKEDLKIALKKHIVSLSFKEKEEEYCEQIFSYAQGMNGLVEEEKERFASQMEQRRNIQAPEEIKIDSEHPEPGNEKEYPLKRNEYSALEKNENDYSKEEFEKDEPDNLQKPSRDKNETEMANKPKKAKKILRKVNPPKRKEIVDPFKSVWKDTWITPLLKESQGYLLTKFKSLDSSYYTFFKEMIGEFNLILPDSDLAVFSEMVKSRPELKFEEYLTSVQDWAIQCPDNSLPKLVQDSIKDFTGLLKDYSDPKTTSKLQNIIRFLERQQDTMPDSSPKKIPINRNTLREIFEFYAKSQTLIGGSASFEDIHRNISVLTLPKYMKFTTDFEISGKTTSSQFFVTAEAASNIFKQHASYARLMSLDEFISSLNSLAEEYYCADYDSLNQSQFSQLLTEEKLQLLCKYMEIDNQQKYLTKLKGFGSFFPRGFISKSMHKQSSNKRFDVGEWKQAYQKKLNRSSEHQFLTKSQTNVKKPKQNNSGSLSIKDFKMLSAKDLGEEEFLQSLVSDSQTKYFGAASKARFEKLAIGMHVVNKFKKRQH